MTPTPPPQPAATTKPGCRPATAQDLIDYVRNFGALYDAGCLVKGLEQLAEWGIPVEPPKPITPLTVEERCYVGDGMETRLQFDDRTTTCSLAVTNIRRMAREATNQAVSELKAQHGIERLNREKGEIFVVAKASAEESVTAYNALVDQAHANDAELRKKIKVLEQQLADVTAQLKVASNVIAEYGFGKAKDKVAALEAEIERSNRDWSAAQERNHRLAADLADLQSAFDLAVAEVPEPMCRRETLRGKVESMAAVIRQQEATIAESRKPQRWLLPEEVSEELGLYWHDSPTGSLAFAQIDRVNAIHMGGKWLPIARPEVPE